MAASGPLQFDLDWEFISRHEGGQRLTAYIPTDPATGEILGNSGVTIGTGVDLGQRTRDELLSLGLSMGLVDRLEPYLGLHRAEAGAALDADPLSVTTSEADRLDRAVGQSIVSDLARRFDGATRPLAFLRLPREAQTVLADLAYQYGPNLAKGKRKEFWDHVTHYHWRDAVRALAEFGDQYDRRRHREALLLWVRAAHSCSVRRCAPIDRI